MNLSPLTSVARQAKTIWHSDGPFPKEELLAVACRLQLRAISSNRTGSRVRRERIAGFDVAFFDYGALALLFDEVFVKQQYGFHSTRPSPVIIDAGSNIGLATLYFKRLYPESRILAFEPDTATFEVLRRNIQENGLRQVQGLQLALGNHQGETELFTDKHRAGAPYASTRADIVRMCTGQENLESASVPLVRLSSYISEPIDLLKLDVEGAEHAVFEDLHTSGKLSLIREVVMEYHHHVLAGEDRLSGVLGILEAQGFGYHVSSQTERIRITGSYQNLLIHAYRKGPA